MDKEARRRVWWKLNQHYHRLRNNLETVERTGFGDERTMQLMRKELAQAKKKADDANEGWTA